MALKKLDSQSSSLTLGDLNHAWLVVQVNTLVCCNYLMNTRRPNSAEFKNSIMHTIVQGFSRVGIVWDEVECAV